MPSVSRILLLCTLALLIGFAPPAHADSMVLTGAGSNVAYGIYVGPYTATVNGVPNTLVICDDFAHESFVPESWTANSSDASNPGSTQNTQTWSVGPAAAAKDYDEIAYLSLLLFSSSNANQSDALQYAIWAIFDPGGVSGYLAGWSGGTAFYTDSSDVDGVTYWLNQAATQVYTANEFANVIIESPGAGPISCGGSPCSNTPPQEFIYLTPEPGGALLLSLGLAGLFLIRRRKGFSLA